jgi:hypothetical protein
MSELGDEILTQGVDSNPIEQPSFDLQGRHSTNLEFNTGTMSTAGQTGQSAGDGNQGGANQGQPTGLVRPRRRVVNSTAGGITVGSVSRNYQVEQGVQFTNFTELKNDMISPEYAQEILEQFFIETKIDMANPKATKMAEDVVFTFYIQNAASQKTGHEKIVDIYGVELDMMLLLRILVSHSVTPRRFVRGVADRIFVFLGSPEMQAMRVDLTSKYTLDNPDHARIAFDGSTHITNITTDVRQIANMLASRGIYENEASVKNAAERTTYDGNIRNMGVKSGTLHNGV